MSLILELVQDLSQFFAHWGEGRRGGLKTPSRNKAAASQILCCELFVRVLWLTLLMIRLMPATLYAQ